MMKAESKMKEFERMKTLLWKANKEQVLCVEGSASFSGRSAKRIEKQPIAVAAGSSSSASSMSTS